MSRYLYVVTVIVERGMEYQCSGVVDADPDKISQIEDFKNIIASSISV